MMTNSINFDVHINQLFPALALGGSIVVPKGGGAADPKYIVDLILQHKVTGFMQTVPTLVRKNFQKSLIAFFFPNYFAVPHSLEYPFYCLIN